MIQNVNIRRFFFILLWCIAGGGMLLVLGASISHKNGKTCQGYRIDVAGRNETFAGLGLDKKELEKLLLDAGAQHWEGRHILSFDLRRMESILKKNAWISNVQLFFDNNQVLRCTVTEREPIARIFSVDGGSCYIDNAGIQLPFRKNRAARLPVFTGYPALKSTLHGADSALALQVRKLGGFILNDPFWMAQIMQIDITPARTFEMATMIGDQLIEFGDGNDYEQKFHRLALFYKEVLSRAGFDSYSRIDVEYAGQVIGTKKGTVGTRIDSLQGVAAIQQLIRIAQQAATDTVHGQNIRPLERNTLTEQTLQGYDLVQDHQDSTNRSKHSN